MGRYRILFWNYSLVQYNLIVEQDKLLLDKQFVCAVSCKCGIRLAAITWKITSINRIILKGVSSLNGA